MVRASITQRSSFPATLDFGRNSFGIPLKILVRREFQTNFTGAAPAILTEFEMTMKRAIILAVAVISPTLLRADQKIQDDLVVVGSICSGFDCASGENFNFDTIRLKENNLRIKFQDTSSSSSFPTVDWQITVNDSVNGGANMFSIEDLDTSTVPFTILAGAPNNAVYVSSNGNVGLGTSTPLVDLQLKNGNSPTLRLEQDASAGFAAQTWDVGGNETGFFIRDFTFGSKLPFRIATSAPNNSLFIAADGDVGFETSTPDGLFDVAHSSDANNHAFLINSNSDVGVNIDNGFVPSGLFDVQTTGGKSRFTVTSVGNVGINLGTARQTLTDPFVIKNTSSSTTLLNLDTSGNLTIAGTLNGAGLSTTGQATNWDLVMSNSNGDFGIKPSTSSTNQLTLQSNGSLILGSGSDNSMTFSNSTISTKKISDGTTWDTVMGDPNLGNAFTVNYGGNFQFAVTTDGNIFIPGTLTSTSDRNRKENIKSIDTAEILENLAAIPVSQWNYKGNDVTHIGPMAQDFWDSFQVGKDDKGISNVDADGVAIASIQELYKRLKQKDKELEDLREHNSTLENRLQRIEELLLKNTQ